MPLNQHAEQFHQILVRAGVRPAGSLAEDYTDEAKASPHWRRPTAEPAPTPPAEVGVQGPEPLPSMDADTWAGRADLK